MHLRHSRTSINPALAFAVRAQALPTSAVDRAMSAVEARLPVLRDDGEGERGAQVAEYAMVTGVGAAGVGVLIALLRSPIFERFVRAIFTLLATLIENWWQ